MEKKRVYFSMLMAVCFFLALLAGSQAALVTVDAPSSAWPANISDELPTAVPGGEWSAYWQMRGEEADGVYNQMTNIDYNYTRRWGRVDGGLPFVYWDNGLRIAAQHSNSTSLERGGAAVLSFKAKPEAGEQYSDVTLTGTLKTWQHELYSTATNEFLIQVIKLSADGSVATIVSSDVITGPSERRAYSDNVSLNVNIGTLSDGESLRLRVQNKAVYSWGWVESPDLQVSYSVVPEPATISLIAIGGLLGLFKRNRN